MATIPFASHNSGFQVGQNNGSITGRRRQPAQQDHDDIRKELENMRIEIRKEIQELQVKLEQVENLSKGDSNLLPSTKSSSFILFRTCFILFSLMSVNITGSAILGIYWTIHFNNMGDGFTAAGWIVAVGTLLLAGPIAYHYPRCSCWERFNRPFLSRVNTVEG